MLFFNRNSSCLFNIKNLLIVFFLVSNVASEAQNLNNTEWTLMRVNRKDGSNLVRYFGMGPISTKYFFKDSSVFSSINVEYKRKTNYSIDKGVLSIGDFLKYRIDSATDIILSLTDITIPDVSEEKKNHFVFVNNNVLFDFLDQTHELTIIGDSLIQCTPFFSPIHEGDLSRTILDEFVSLNANKIISGCLIMTETGHIQDLYFDVDAHLSKHKRQKILNAFQSTEGSWRVPMISRPLLFKLDFAIKLFADQTSFGVKIIFFYDQVREINIDSLDLHDDLAGDLFKEGNKLYDRRQFGKAADIFKSCMKEDPQFIKAYYQLALCYMKLKNTKSACDIWYQLKQMGQEEANIYYSTKCQIQPEVPADNEN